MSKLVIVESPTKAKTITRMLDSGYKVVASMGHVRDLPERAIGVDLEHDFAPMYVDTARSKKVVKELKDLAKDADEIYLAPDPDREGEAIAWHLQEVLRKNKKQVFHRVTFHEITHSAITKAMESKGEIDMNLVDSQQARRILDRIVGYKVSPLLWSKLQKGMSAGRVQSVALRLIVERERLIAGFQPEEYWVFSLVFETAGGDKITCKLFKINGENFRVSDEKNATDMLEAILNGDAPSIREITRSEKRRQAPPPFTTSTLQQAASSALHMSPSNTMRYAQQLYEGLNTGSGVAGLITYMRTDSVTIAKEAQASAADFIRGAYGDAFVPARPNFFKNKGAAQEAHEAVRPTDVFRTPESLKGHLDDSQLKLYTLIWRRFVASQMTPAIYNQTTLDVGILGRDRQDYLFRAVATVPKFAGFMSVYPDAKSKDESDGAQELSDSLNQLAQGDKLKIAGAEKEQKFTEPPPHFSEASLIKELEENGIGRPSTYASILKTIQQRDYVIRDKGKLIPTESGYQVNDFLVGYLPELFDVGFTAEMENELDKIESGELGWTAMLHSFYDRFGRWLDHAQKHDAPPEDLVKELLHAMRNVQFGTPEKVGKRTYDDGKFFRSVSEKFAKDAQVSAKQYAALLTLAVKYRTQLADVTAALEPLLAQATVESAEKKEKQEKNQASESQQSMYATVFGSFKDVQWEPPKTGRGRVFDEKKFFDSLAKQAESGKMLSDKQLAVLKRMAVKYGDMLLDKENVCRLLEISDTPEAAEAAEGQNQEVKALLEQLAKVTQWAEPTKKGRFTYDDKAFYESLSKQFESGKSLSEKQVAALGKLAKKY